MARAHISSEIDKSPLGRFSWLAVPSWVLSLLLHASFLGVLAFTMRGPAIRGTHEAADRIVGIYTKESHAAVPEADAADSQPANPSKQPQAAETALPKVNADDAAADKLLDLPAVTPQRIGPGPAFPIPATAAAQPVIKPILPGKPDAKPAQGSSGVPFFDAEATGKRFVYVLDSSGSMANHNAIGVAKTELLASLQTLDANQEFLIIFYNETSTPMLRLGSKNRLLAATDVNRNQARQFIRSIQPDGGTNHLLALMDALDVKPQPDVLFFLSDADTGLSAADLERVRKKNSGKSQIHTVEFGAGANISKVPSFLKKLAGQNGGTYSYRDVTQFDRN